MFFLTPTQYVHIQPPCKSCTNVILLLSFSRFLFTITVLTQCTYGEFHLQVHFCHQKGFRVPNETKTVIFTYDTYHSVWRNCLHVQMKGTANSLCPSFIQLYWQLTIVLVSILVGYLVLIVRPDINDTVKGYFKFISFNSNMID